MLAFETLVHDGQGGATVQLSRHGGGRRGAEEIHMVVTPHPGGSPRRQLLALCAAYREALEHLALAPDTAVFRRVFLSDYANQLELLRGSPLADKGEAGPVAVSLVEQPPLPEHKIALWAYHVAAERPLDKRRTAHGVVVRRGALDHLWTADVGFSEPACEASARSQTRRIFQAYLAELEALGANLAEHAVRTWLFVQNVDVNYAAMVEARAELFARHGLTADTHYIASTGIEGRHADATRLVLLDAYAIANLRPGQLRYLSAPDHLGPTSLYGVTFERGVRVQHGDRSHVFISGTASIEPGGRTLHPGDVVMQARRTLDNVEALLVDAGVGPRDVAQMIVYLRDPADRRLVEGVVRERYPAAPMLVVRAPVCRPDWLVEIECIAIGERRDPLFQPY